MSKVLANPVSLSDAEVDKISATLLGSGVAFAEVGRGGFLPFIGEDEDSQAILGRVEGER